MNACRRIPWGNHRIRDLYQVLSYFFSIVHRAGALVNACANIYSEKSQLLPSNGVRTVGLRRIAAPTPCA